jgi:hypothetical protein
MAHTFERQVVELTRGFAQPLHATWTTVNRISGYHGITASWDGVMSFKTRLVQQSPCNF